MEPKLFSLCIHNISPLSLKIYLVIFRNSASHVNFLHNIIGHIALGFGRLQYNYSFMAGRQSWTCFLVSSTFHRYVCGIIAWLRLFSWHLHSFLWGPLTINGLWTDETSQYIRSDINSPLMVTPVPLDDTIEIELCKCNTKIVSFWLLVT